MYRRKKPAWLTIILPALAVGGVFWVLKVWPFDRPPTLAMRVPAVPDGARDAYQDLSATFRAKITTSEFVGMYERMWDPDDGRPVIRSAAAPDPEKGPERPQASYRVDYPDARVQADYCFARIDEGWQLQSFCRRTVGGPGPPAPRDKGGSKPPTRAPSGPKPATRADRTHRPGTSSLRPGPPTRPAQSPRYHIVQAGDTLERISLKYYGTRRRWQRIVEANPGLDPRRMRPGRKILIPRFVEQAPKPTTTHGSTSD